MKKQSAYEFIEPRPLFVPPPTSCSVFYRSIPSLPHTASRSRGILPSMTISLVTLDNPANDIISECQEESLALHQQTSLRALGIKVARLFS